MSLSEKITRVRHKHDPPFDKIVIELEDRYKQSYASGDEWRYGNRVYYFYKGKLMKDSFGTGNLDHEELAYIANTVKEHTPSNVWWPPEDATFADFCSQPGCAEKATRAYAFKKIYNRSCTDHVLNDDTTDKPLGLLFCDKHGDRGDCALDDANENYVCVAGKDWTNAETPDEKRSRSGHVAVDGISGSQDYLVAVLNE